MNTKRSREIITRFQNMAWEPRRTVFHHEGLVFGRPDAVFPLLCPAREADWIPTWDAEIVYSETGYAARGDVFRSPGSTGFGDGVWVFTGYEENRYVELVQVTADVLIQLKVGVSPVKADEAGRETLVQWDYMLTSLTPQGAEKMTRGLVSEENFNALQGALDHYLRQGEMVRMPENG